LGKSPFAKRASGFLHFLKNMRNSHLEKSKRNQRIRRFLAAGWTQTKIAEEYNISVQRVNNLVARFRLRRLKSQATLNSAVLILQTE